MNTAIGYTRVSTARQANGGVSLEAQRERIEAYCRVNDLTLVDVLCDPGESGASLLTRPEALRAIDDAKSKGAALVVYSLSRMFRNVVEGITTQEQLEAAGANLISTTQSIDTRTASGWAAFVMQLVFDELEVRQTRERTKHTLRFKRSRGQRVSHSPTFGYRLADRPRWDAKKERNVYDQVPDPDEQRAIAEIIRLGKLKYGLRAIGRKLYDAGFTSRTGSVLTPKTIGEVLIREGLRPCHEKAKTPRRHAAARRNSTPKPGSQ